jgi:hypothetical protein
LLVAFVVSGLFSRYVALQYMREGVQAFLKKKLPLTKGSYLTGWMAQLGAILFIAFGIFALLSILAVTYFCTKGIVRILSRW